MTPLVMGSSKTFKISAAASLGRRRTVSRHHRNFAANRSLPGRDRSQRAEQSDAVASKTYNPHNPAAQIPRAFVQSGFNEVRIPVPQNCATDLTEASRFPRRVLRDSWEVGVTPDLNSKRWNGACNLLMLLIWGLDFSKTWCHVSLFNRLDC